MHPDAYRAAERTTKLSHLQLCLLSEQRPWPDGSRPPLSRPRFKAVTGAQLFSVGALDIDGRITPYGEELLRRAETVGWHAPRAYGTAGAAGQAPNVAGAGHG
jgi:hypothetical protein